jgi:hypothetical protein
MKERPSPGSGPAHFLDKAPLFAVLKVGDYGEAPQLEQRARILLVLFDAPEKVC